MKRSHLVLLLVFSIGILFSSRGYACKCMSISVNEAFNKSNAVFIGEAVSIEKVDRFLNVKLDVLVSYKGIEQKAYIIVKTAPNDESCGFPFNIGEKYLVFAHGEDAYYTGICSNTRRLDEAKEILEKLPEPIFSYINISADSGDDAAKIDSLLKSIEKGVTKYKDEQLLLKIKDTRLLFKDYSSKMEIRAKTACSCPKIGCPPCPPCNAIQKTDTGEMTEQDFNKFYSTFKSESSDKDRLRLVESIMNGGSKITVSQVIALLKGIDFSSNKKKFFLLIKGHIVDPQNIYQIYNHLDFQSEKDEAKRILEGK